MFKFLKKHPFGVKAFFKQSIVVTYAVPKEQLENLIPPCVTLDLLDDKWAFLAIALVKTTKLRPRFFPDFLGNSFDLIGYRVFVRYTNTKGKNLRGLYILKSETNSKKMEFLGNIFTQYQYKTTDIITAKNENSTKITSGKSNFTLEISNDKTDVKLPQNSVFPDWKIARRFAGPLPFTFTFNPKNNEVLIIEGKRENWIPKPIEIKNCNFEFIKSLGLNEVVLSNAFSIENIPYEWKKGKTEIWKP
jgi:hypothetical protein